jgi:hypothetical protein
MPCSRLGSDMSRPRVIIHIHRRFRSKLTLCPGLFMASTYVLLISAPANAIMNYLLVKVRGPPNQPSLAYR